MAVPPPIPDKSVLRTALRQGRRRFVAALGAAGRAEAEAALCGRLRPLLDRAGPVAGYVAMGGEPDVMPFLDAAAAAGTAIALPHIGTDRAMSFAFWEPGAALAEGPLGIRQPAAAGDAVPAVLLVPLVGFERGGARLGQGAGYYDRWFAAHPHALRIGIAWSVQEVPALPLDAWDVPLHAIVTEREWIAP